MSTLVFNIAHFFPSLNHWLLPLILNKAGFDPRISSFFTDYLVGRKTCYLWNNFSSPLFNVDVGVGQGLALLLVLSALYLTPIFYILEKILKNLKIPVILISFIDNGLFVLQEKSFEKSNSYLFCSYNIILFLLDQFGLVIKYGKTENFHFFRSYRAFNSSPLDLSILGDPILHPKDI